MVLPANPESRVSDLARAGLDTIALRWPKHYAAAALIEAFGGPLVAPSANRSGHVSPTRAEHVAADLGDRIDLILDGGPCAVGLESTIIGFEGGEPILLRPGGPDKSIIPANLDSPVSTRSPPISNKAPRQPKTLSSHGASVCSAA